MDDAAFKTTVNEYVALSTELAAAAKALRGVKKRKTELGVAIQAFMKEKDVDACTLPDGRGKIVRVEAKRQETLKKTHVAAELGALGVPDTKREEIMTAIDAAREVVSKTKLKVVTDGGGDAENESGSGDDQ